MKGLQYICLPLLALACISAVFSQSSTINMEIDFQTIKIPIGEPVQVAYLSVQAGEVLLGKVAHEDITRQIDIPNLRPTYLLSNGWILHKKFVGGNGPLVFRERDSFLRFKNWDYYLSGGPVFHPAPPQIGYTMYSLKPLAVEILQRAHTWEEIPSLLPNSKLYRAEDGSIMELAWPHYNCGEWYSSYKEYTLCVKLISE
jgi:hypothetical protein